MNEEITSPGGYTFYGCENIRYVYLGKNVGEIWFSVFSFCDGITSFEISSEHEKMKAVGDAVISKDDLTFILMYNKNIEKIENGELDRFSDIYYDGTAEDWAKVSTGSETKLNNVHFEHYINNILAIFGIQI